MPTTQCQIGPRFSAVQPPSELIPCHAISYQTSQSTIHFLAGQAVENFNAFSTYILCIAATRSQPAIRTYHSIPTLETKHTTTPNERSSRLTTPPLALDERTPHDTQDRTKHTHTQHALSHPNPRTMRGNSLRPPALRLSTIPLRHTHISLRLSPTCCSGQDPASGATRHHTRTET